MHLPDVAVYSARTVLPTEARAYTIVMTEFAVSPWSQLDVSAPIEQKAGGDYLFWFVL